MLTRFWFLAAGVLGLLSILVWYAFDQVAEHARSECHEREPVDRRVTSLQDALAACGRRSEQASVEAEAQRTLPAGTSPTRIMSERRSSSFPNELRVIADRRKYGLLFRELELSEVEEEQLLQILGKQANDRIAMTALLGSERAARFDAARKTLFARADIRALRDDLELAGGGVLSAEQQQRLLESLTVRGVPPPPIRGVGEDPADAAARTSVWLDERDDALRDAATKVLTPRQMQLANEGLALRRAREPFRASAMMASGAAGASAVGL